ncbi:MAG: NAD(+)/NADH kinase [Thermomicrobiales bacterium]|nr:NAD(+)/NADH kinase [Thermomicrobiales bacterium]
MPHKFGLVAAFSKPEASELADDITVWLEARDCAVIPESELTSNAAHEVDAIVVLGGDGLMMRAANAYPDTPLLGINFGKVGFLALVERADWEFALNALLAHDYKVEVGSTLAARIVRGEREIDPGWAINDIVIRGGNRMIDIEAYIDGHFVNTYPGDGMIVSTPRGSTAYCMAAGGPILTAGVRGFALVPISCHSPIRTPMVVAESALVELVQANRHEAQLILDGRTVASLEYGDVVKISQGAHRFKLIAVGGANFYDAFRTKFNFSIRPDAIPSRSALPKPS